jgi:hypothetical protein
MIITVTRDTFTDQSVTSTVSLDGIARWFGIEPPRLPAGSPKPFCIPTGTYPIKLLPSAHFDMTVPCVQDVPGFTGIEIHPGNYPRDTHGCLCIGESRGPDDVTQSVVAFDELMLALQADPDNISIIYSEE